MLKNKSFSSLLGRNTVKIQSNLQHSQATTSDKRRHNAWSSLFCLISQTKGKKDPTDRRLATAYPKHQTFSSQSFIQLEPLVSDREPIYWDDGFWISHWLFLTSSKPQSGAMVWCLSSRAVCTTLLRAWEELSEPNGFTDRYRDLKISRNTFSPKSMCNRTSSRKRAPAVWLSQGRGAGSITGG